MRLIDADDVLDSIENWKRKVLYYHPHTKKFSTIPLSEVLSFLEDSPTIDAVPVKHGEWVDDGGLYRCSSCNHLWSELWWTENCPIERMLKIMPYCPNCGAKMDGGKDNE